MRGKRTAAKPPRARKARVERGEGWRLNFQAAERLACITSGEHGADRDGEGLCVKPLDGSDHPITCQRRCCRARWGHDYGEGWCVACGYADPLARFEASEVEELIDLSEGWPLRAADVLWRAARLQRSQRAERSVSRPVGSRREPAGQKPRSNVS